MELEHMEQISPSATLWQRWQNFISVRILAITSLNWPTFEASCFNKCNTSRRAVFLPMPGSLANSLTAFSSREDENCITKDKAPIRSRNTAGPSKHSPSLSKILSKILNLYDEGMIVLLSGLRREFSPLGGVRGDRYFKFINEIGFDANSPFDWNYYFGLLMFSKKFSCIPFAVFIPVIKNAK